MRIRLPRSDGHRWRRSLVHGIDIGLCARNEWGDPLLLVRPCLPADESGQEQSKREHACRTIRPARGWGKRSSAPALERRRPHSVEIEHRLEGADTRELQFQLLHLSKLDLRLSCRSRSRDDVRSVWFEHGSVSDGRDGSLAHRLDFVRQLTDARIRWGQTSSFVERVPSVREFSRIDS